MYIVGIDIAKRKHEAAVIDGEGTVIIKPFSFTNNCSGYNRLLAMLTKAKLPLDEVSFAMEATGHYWLALFTRLQKEGFRVQVINPVQTNSIRSFYIRQAKTDPRDALLIAEVIRFGHFSESTLHPENIYELRELCRGRAVPDDYLDFLAAFYLEAVSGIMIGWIQSDMESSEEQLTRYLLIALEGSLETSLDRYVRSSRMTEETG